MIPSDNPISTSDQDLLGRALSARLFAHQILSSDCSQGMVAAVLGEWGSGKTSFINMAREEFESADIPVLSFNPWMFSGAEQLVSAFFLEISAQLKLRAGLAEIGKKLEDYGEILVAGSWLPVVGPLLQRGLGAVRAFNSIANRRKAGIDPSKDKVTNALAELDKPILVVIDDIDRLTTPEIRDVFKLVRLTASFPNLIYVLAFDRTRVEEALAEQGIPGGAYLEKIVQLGFDLPVVSDQILRDQALAAIDEVIHHIENPGPFHEETWPDVFVEIIQPLIKNMRDIRRYTAAVHGTASALDGKVALVDLLALEAVRVFLPSAFRRLTGALEGLTTPSSTFVYGTKEPPHLKEQITHLMNSPEADNGVVKAMIERLFPPAQRHIGGSHYSSDFQGGWLKSRRVAHAEILRLYFQRVESSELKTFLNAEEALTLVSDEEAFDRYLRSLDESTLEDVVAALENFEEDFDATTALPGIVVLLNLLPDIPERERGMLEFDARIAVGRVTYRLLKAAGDAAVIEELTKDALPKIKTLSSQLELITDVGHRENAGHRMIPEAAAAELERGWRERVRSASPSELVDESDLLRVLWLVKREAKPEEPELVLPDVLELTWAVLRSALTFTRSQSMGTRAVHRSPRLIWEGLVEVFGSESTLKERISGLEPAKEGDDDLLRLVNRYLDGWRPKEFGEH